MLCHGYGQLARDFLADCTPLAADGVLLVAPEGLSRFYQRSGRGQIGASWMTSEDRVAEIQDYLAWLNSVWDRVCEECSTTPTVSVLGFSQGGATAARWGLLGKATVAQIVLWGTTLPGKELREHAHLLTDTPLTIVDGRADRIVQRDEFVEGLRVLQEIGAAFQIIEHSGGHELDGAVMSQLAEAAPWN